MSRSMSGLRSVLVVSVLSAVLSCHVLGMLCLMIPSVAMGEPALVLLPASHHAATSGHECGQYVPSAADRVDGPKPVPSTDPSSLALALAMPDPAPCLAALDPPRSLRGTGTPLFAYLSTFRL